MERTSTGLQENMASGLSYILGPISGIIMLILERENKTVKFHALQSLIGFGAAEIILGILGGLIGLLSRIPILGFIFGMFGWVVGILNFALFIGCLYCAYMAYKGAKFSLPIVGDICYGTINK